MRVVIVGAGGQAREAAWYLEETNRVRETFKLAGFVVTDLGRLGANDSVDRVLGDYDWIESHEGELDGIVLAIGTPAARLRVAGELATRFPRLEWPSVCHPSARIDVRSSRLGRGVMLGPNVCATVGVEVGDFALLNFGCTVGHETRVGRGCVVNPGANLSGGVLLGDRVLVGAGAVVLEYRTVGDEATVGAGAVVTRDVPAGVTVVGIPARPRLQRGCPGTESR